MLKNTSNLTRIDSKKKMISSFQNMKKMDLSTHIKKQKENKRENPFLKKKKIVYNYLKN